MLVLPGMSIFGKIHYVFTPSVLFYIKGKVSVSSFSLNLWNNIGIWPLIEQGLWVVSMGFLLLTWLWPCGTYCRLMRLMFWCEVQGILAFSNWVDFRSPLLTLVILLLPHSQAWGQGLHFSTWVGFWVLSSLLKAWSVFNLTLLRSATNQNNKLLLCAALWAGDCPQEWCNCLTAIWVRKVTLWKRRGRVEHNATAAA